MHFYSLLHNFAEKNISKEKFCKQISWLKDYRILKVSFILKFSKVFLEDLINTMTFVLKVFLANSLRNTTTYFYRTNSTQMEFNIWSFKTYVFKMNTMIKKCAKDLQIQIVLKKDNNNNNNNNNGFIRSKINVGQLTLLAAWPQPLKIPENP